MTRDVAIVSCQLLLHDLDTPPLSIAVLEQSRGVSMMQTSRWVGAASPRGCGHFIPAGRGAGRGPVYHHSTPTDSRRAFVRFVPCSRLPPPFLSSADGNALFFSCRHGACGRRERERVGAVKSRARCRVPTGAVAPEAEGGGGRPSSAGRAIRAGVGRGRVRWSGTWKAAPV